MFSDVVTDVRHAARSFLRAPVWTLTLTLTVALGVGSRAAVQGFVHGTATSQLPIPSIDTVVTIFALDRQGVSGPLSFEAFTALSERRDLFDSLGAIRESQERVTFGTRSMLLPAAFYTADVAAVLPLLASDGVSLSHRLRFAEFDINTDPTGTALRVGNDEGVVTATAPYWLEGLYRGRSIDLWVTMDPEQQIDGRAELWLLGRLRAGVSIDTARAAVDRMRVAGAESIALVAYTAQTPEAATATLRVRTLLTLAAAAVFLVACANVAAFLLARAYARARETALRVAIGARRRQLARQVVIDSLMLALFGGVAGLIVASWMTNLVPLMFYDQDADRLVFAPDTRGILLTTVISVALIVFCGLIALLEVRDDRPSAVLQREVAGPSKMMQRINAGLILFQMAACATLVISTGLLLQGLRGALETESTRRLGNPVLATIEAIPRLTKAGTQEGLEYFDAVIEAARSVTPVEKVVWAARLPGVRAAWQEMLFDPLPSETRHVVADVAPFTTDVLERTEVLAGRLFNPLTRSCESVVLGEAAATDWFGAAAVGRVVEGPAKTLFEVRAVARVRDLVRSTVFVAPEAAMASVAGPAEFAIPASDTLASGLIDVNVVSANYFESLGFSLTVGESFDAKGRGCRIGVVNEEAAVRLFAGRAIGAAVIDTTGVRTEIVGVVKSKALGAEQRTTEPTLFLPMLQDFLPRMTAMLVAPAADAAIVRTLQRRMAAVPGGRSDRMTVTLLDAYLGSTTLAPTRIATVFVTTFAALALLLGALGLYGAMAESARRRQREFAMRLALGAQSWRVMRQLMIEGMRLAAVGTAAGMVLSFGAARSLARLTPGAEWPPLSIWLAAPLLLAAAVAVASIIPARRAASVDLLSLMRQM